MPLMILNFKNELQLFVFFSTLFLPIIRVQKSFCENQCYLADFIAKLLNFGENRFQFYYNILIIMDKAFSFELLKLCT